MYIYIYIYIHTYIYTHTHIGGWEGVAGLNREIVFCACVCVACVRGGTGGGDYTKSVATFSAPAGTLHKISSHF